MNIILNLISASTLLYTLMLSSAHAVCPVCTIIVGAGLGLSKYLGIDDTVTGIWIGGFILSISLWLASILRNSDFYFRYSKLIIILLMYLATIIPLYYINLIGISGNTILGIDKLLFGITLGTIFYMLGVLTDIMLRAFNDCVVYFYYQKVILPVIFLVIATFIVCFCY